MHFLGLKIAVGHLLLVVQEVRLFRERLVPVDGLGLGMIVFRLGLVEDDHVLLLWVEVYGRGLRVVVLGYLSLQSAGLGKEL